MTMDLGDRTEDSTLCFHWSTNAKDGAAITRSADGTVSVYKDDSDTQSVEGVTDTEDFDSLTGIHMCKIVLTNAFYAAGSDYSVILSAATIDGETVNAVLATFSIENRFMRGTDSAALAATALTDATWTDARAGYLDNLVSILASTTMLTTTIESDNRNTTNCQMAAGSVEDNAYIGMRVVLVGDSGTGYVSRTITDYASADNVVTWSPAIAQAPEDGGNIYIVPGDTTINVTAATILADTNELQGDDIPGAISGLENLSAAGAEAACDAAFATYDPPTDTEMVAAFTEIKGATWAAGTDTMEHIRNKQTDIEADTNELQTDNIPGTLAVIDGKIDTVDGKIVALNDISTANVNTEVSDVMKTDVISEQAQGVPPTTPTFEEAIMYLYMALTKRGDANTALDPDYKKFYNNAGTVIYKKAITDDDSDYSEAKAISGA